MTRLLLRPREAAERLGVSRAKLYQWIASGRIRSIRVDGLRRIPARALKEFVERIEQDEKPRPAVERVVQRRRQAK